MLFNCMDKVYFVITMAGLARRFAEAGLRAPKYMLEAGGRTLRYLVGLAVALVEGLRARSGREQKYRENQHGSFHRMLLL